MNKFVSGQITERQLLDIATAEKKMRHCICVPFLLFLNLDGRVTPLKWCSMQFHGYQKGKIYHFIAGFILRREENWFRQFLKI